MKLSPCRRFVIVEALYIDRNALGALATWAAEHGLGAQDAPSDSGAMTSKPRRPNFEQNFTTSSK